MFRNCKRWDTHCPPSTDFLTWASQVVLSGKEPTCQCRRFKRWVRTISWRRKLQPTPVFLGFPGGSVGKESACNAGDPFNPCIGRIPWRREWLPTPVFLSGESMDWGTWRATVHRVTKSQTWLKWLSKQYSLLPVLYNRSLLLTCFIYINLYLLISNS